MQKKSVFVIHSNDIIYPQDATEFFGILLDYCEDALKMSSNGEISPAELYAGKISVMGKDADEKVCLTNIASANLTKNINLRSIIRFFF